MWKVNAIAVVLLLWAGGCATVRAPQPMTPQEVDLLKARLGEIGVARARYVPQIEVQTPSKGSKEGAKDGAVVGALAPIEVTFGAVVAAGCGDPYCLLLPLAGVALAPVGAVVGAVGGAVTADPEEVVSGREAIIQDAITKLRMQEHMHEQFVSRLAASNTFPFRALEEAGPTAPEEKPDYRQFKDDGIQTINEISVKMLRLTGLGKVKPRLSVHLDVQTRLVSTDDNTELYCEVLTCSSGNYRFEKWAENEAKQFREEIGVCYIDLSNWAVYDVYVYPSIMQTEVRPKHFSPKQSTSKCE